MALIAVVCVVGVVSGELLGPMAQLRASGRVGDDAQFTKKSAWRAEVADDTFQFTPETPLLMELLPKLASTSQGSGGGRYYPSPVFSPVSMLFDKPPDDGGAVDLVDFQSAGQLSGTDPSNADITPPTQLAQFVSYSTPMPNLFTAAPAAVVNPPPTAAVPEPDSWLLMILGFGGVGSALRRRRAAGSRPPNAREPADLRT